MIKKQALLLEWRHPLLLTLLTLPTGCNPWAAAVQMASLLSECQSKTGGEHVPGRWPAVGPGLLLPKGALRDRDGHRSLPGRGESHGACPLCSRCASPWGELKLPPTHVLLLSVILAHFCYLSLWNVCVVILLSVRPGHHPCHCWCWQCLCKTGRGEVLKRTLFKQQVRFNEWNH